jgi:hypothetical protein
MFLIAKEMKFNYEERLKDMNCLNEFKKNQFVHMKSLKRQISKRSKDSKRRYAIR